MSSTTNVRRPGGCPDCDAYTVLQETAPGVIVAAIYHDDTCPWLARQEVKR